MRYSRNIYILLIISSLVFLIAGNICYAETTAISNEQWQQLTQDKAFGYSTAKEAIQKTNTGNTSAFASALMALFSFFSSSIGRVIIWTLFFSLLAWILFKVFFSERLFARRSEKQSEDQPVPVQDMETELLLTDWEQRMQKAAKEGDTAMAVKYSYLHLLKLLQQKELIRFRNDKTNHDYHQELIDISYRSPFKQLTRQYEFIWYGKYPLTEQQYHEYMSIFNELKNKLAAR